MEDLWHHCAAILLNVLCVLLHIYGGCVSEKCSPVNSCGFFIRKRGRRNLDIVFVNNEMFIILT